MSLATLMVVMNLWSFVVRFMLSMFEHLGTYILEHLSESTRISWVVCADSTQKIQSTCAGSQFLSHSARNKLHLGQCPSLKFYNVNMCNGPPKSCHFNNVSSWKHVNLLQTCRSWSISSSLHGMRVSWMSRHFGLAVIVPKMSGCWWNLVILMEVLEQSKHVTGVAMCEEGSTSTLNSFPFQ